MKGPQEYYEHSRLALAARLDKVIRQERLVSRLRLLSAAAIAYAGYRALSTGGLPNWLFLLGGVMVFLVLGRISIGLEERHKAFALRLKLLEAELRALAGDRSAFPDGRAFIDTAHPYSFDLDLFGPGSVYQLLCRSVTWEGRRQLAVRLGETAGTKTTVLQRQDAVRELAAAPEFMLDFRVAGLATEESPEDLANLHRWLAGDAHFINSLFAKAATLVLPLATIAGIGWSIFSGRLHPLLTLCLILNTLVLIIWRQRTRASAALLAPAVPVIEKYAALLGVLADQDFQSALLQDHAAAARHSLTAIRSFRQEIQRFDTRNNGMVGPLMNLLFLFDLFCLLRLERWRSRHGGQLEQAESAMTETDVLISGGVFAFNHPACTYPEIAANGRTYQASGLRHPLLPGASAVGNDFRLGADEQLFLLTGANMTGKSTFIRTLGVSMVLAYFGCPLPARSASLPLLRLFTSIRVTDSVQEDVSYFKAELARIGALMQTVRSEGPPSFVLIDEPLRGTNSDDKQSGTRAIIEKLLQQDVVGIVATHDTGLCALETSLAGRVRNYHFESEVADGSLRFDYRLKRGCASSANASVLMRLMGIID